MVGRVEVHLAPQGRETLAAYRPPAKRNRRHRSVSYWRKLRTIKTPKEAQFVHACPRAHIESPLPEVVVGLRY